ncbi:hypothetical protein [Halogranum rubrum]|uniref:Uncharacterized protein n=1 Tax=Halogranum salarium B-1 TaxID=1210908 RepID=J3JF38_9EURY|nr:hypothetical protein [Halogranum salarium]EJN58919.1 hypothetical protein HSB1_23400 [Halogranum salarium B-1]
MDTETSRTCAVVRGHDQTHGYGGQATLVNLETGATRGVRQGMSTVADSRDVPVTFAAG